MVCWLELCAKLIRELWWSLDLKANFLPKGFQISKSCQSMIFQLNPNPLTYSYSGENILISLNIGPGSLCSCIQSPHRRPWGQRRAGWSGPGRSCGWAGWCRSGPPLSPGCSAGSAPSCFPSPLASWKLLPIRTRTPRTSGLGGTFGRRRIWQNSALQDPLRRPAPSGPLLPLKEDGGGDREWVYDSEGESMTTFVWFNHIKSQSITNDMAKNLHWVVKGGKKSNRVFTK